jgi:GLPGLI family protein
MKKYFLLFHFYFFIFIFFANAQTQFFSTVKIEFEKTVATRALYKELFPESFDEWKDHISQNSISYFDFISDSLHSIYKPGRDVPVDPRMWEEHIADKNIVYTDYKKNESISQKPVYEETFLIEDSLLNIKWKITPDTRDIAGFECHKAIGILFDTVAVFAFYTDQIMIPGGPEGIHGLPGMILGVGIPRLHTTWFATKVEVVGVPIAQIHPEKKGKKSDRQNLLQLLDQAMKNWGGWNTYGKKMILAIQI